MSREDQKTLGVTALKIVRAEPDHKFSLDENLLKSVLDMESVKDREVVLISVAGAFRTGKSFLLGFFLRYLYAKYEHLSMVNDDAWLGNDDEPLVGFHWRGGSDRDTIGILIWEKIFLHTTLDGRKLAIIVMDTQGVFDGKSPLQQNATVFALSTMLSSIQIYNITNNIREDDLSNLQIFTEYGRLAMEETGRKPFQKLLFLIRDWSGPSYGYNYGFEGGKDFLSKVLEISPDLHIENVRLREGLKELFSEMQCFLLPHPGLQVVQDSEFRGNLSNIDFIFKKQLLALIPKLLAPENLIVKEIGGQIVTCQSLLHYLKSYLDAFSKNGGLPDPKSIFESNVAANNLSAVDATKRKYQIYTNDIIAGGYLKPETLTEKHNQIVATCLHFFDQQPKIGKKTYSKNYRLALETDLNASINSVLKQNARKNFGGQILTPLTLLVILMFTHLFHGFFSYLFLGVVDDCLAILWWIALTFLISWIGLKILLSRYDISICAKAVKLLDVVLNVFVYKVVFPAYIFCMNKSASAERNRVGLNLVVNTVNHNKNS